MMREPLSLSVTERSSVAFKEEFPVPSIPYRGIEHYRFVDHRIFFARQAETLELMRSVMIYKGVILFGGSGAGKSSLIDAGLLPRLIEMDFSPDRIRVQNRKDEEIVIERISKNDDGKAPYLSPSLADAIAEDERSRIVLPLEKFREGLRAYAENHYPLLVLDQFEEIITLFEETPREAGAREEILKRQKKLIDFFVGVLHDESLRCKILFSFREDYLAKLTKVFVHAPELPNQYMRLTPPQKKALHPIIAGPLAPEMQAHYERQQQFSSELIDELEDQFKQRDDDDTINLSEVQIVCLKLWESADPVQLFSERGVQGLLEDYLTGELDQFSAEHRVIAIGLLSHMLTFSNTRNFISGVELIHLFQNEEPVSEQILKDVLIALTGTRLVRRELRYKDYFYEIASEFLVPKIIEKKIERQARLERWRLEAERAEERRQAEQKLRQKNRLLALGLLVTALSLALVVVLFMKNRQEESLKIQAQVAQARADQKASENEQIISILDRLFKNLPAPQLNERELNQVRLNLLTDKITAIGMISTRLQAGEIPPDQVSALIDPSLTNNRDEQVAQAARDLLSKAAEVKAAHIALRKQLDQDKLAAIHEMKTLMTKQTFRPNLVLSLLGPTLTDKTANPEVVKAAQALLAEASAANKELEISITTAGINNPAIANRIPPRVYIQMESEQQLNQANSLKAALEKNNYIVPEFEIVGPFRAPAKNELRFYKSEDEAKAKEIVDILKNIPLEVETKNLEKIVNSTRSRAGHYELWLASKSSGAGQYYVVITAPAAGEKRQALLDQISSIAEPEKIADLSRNELVIGPYEQKQEAQNLRQRLIDQDPDLGKKGRTYLLKR